MELTGKARLGRWLFTIPAAVFGILEIYGVNSHNHNPSWPAHARFHAVTGTFNLLALCLFALVLTWKFLPRGHTWAWWGLFVIGFAVFGGLVIGNPMTGGGLSGGGESLGNPRLFTALAWLSVVLWAAGLALTRSSTAHEVRHE